jgi:hypothetical protein
MRGGSLSVAAPWSLSHYIPLNSFHPLYGALFNECPAHISINAWNNLELSNVIRNDKVFQEEMLRNAERAHAAFQSKMSSTFIKKYTDIFFAPNIALTSLLPGDIEFHHTAPFPSMTRPFVFHCESFAPIFSPFMKQVGEEFQDTEILREHYGKIFSDPLCMGIFSNIPDTLEQISSFFKSPYVDTKLYMSRIGFSQRASVPIDSGKMNTLSTPRFLFTSSSNQSPENFVDRGGNIVLRFWLKFVETCPGAKLYLHCPRPDDDVLAGLGVDIVRLRKEQSRSVIWMQEFINDREHDRLMSHVHFLLLPGASLDSVSIMRAMALGTILFVSNATGNERYVTHGVNGIVLDGVDDHRQNRLTEDELIQQIEKTVTRLMDQPSAYEALQRGAMESSATAFSGTAFAEDFWRTVEGLWGNASGQRKDEDIAGEATHALQHCLLDQTDLPRIFDTVPQPITRIATGRGRVTELAGAFIYTEGNREIDQHEWSVLAEYWKPGAPALVFVHDIHELDGEYLTATAVVVSNPVVDFCTRLLFPYPRIYRLASRILKLARKWWRKTEARTEPAHVDIQLMAQDVSGMNIIRCRHYYYAIPQDGGEFSEEKANHGGYRVCFKGNSLKAVLAKIAGYEQTGEALRLDKPVPILVEEGFGGFNIIRYADSFFAIPQHEGAFSYERVIVNGYSQFHAGMTLEATKLAITGAPK